MRRKMKGTAVFLLGMMLGTALMHMDSGGGARGADIQTSAEKTAVEKEGLEQEPRKIALTFDDGPHPVYTPKLLDGLKERGITATFFLIGRNAEAYPDVVRRIYEEGHLIGNHTYSHVRLSDLTEEEVRREVEQTSNLIEELVGEPLIYIRPPFGDWKEDIDCGMGVIPVWWTVDSRDWETGNAAEIVKRVVTQAEENDIILMHDWYESSVDAALQIADILEQQGYEFVTAEELILP